jgi:hypothetical protein
MKLKNISLNLLCVTLLLGLTGCAKYRVNGLRTLSKNAHVKQQSISFSYRTFSVSDCRKYLGRNTIRKGYQPIQITFVNNSDRYFVISKRGLSFECVRTKTVAKSMHFNTAGRVVGYTILGLFLWPFLIPAVVDGIGAAKANKTMDADFAEKTLSKQIVEPYTTVNGIVFVDADTEFEDEFTFTVSDINHNQYLLSTEKPEVAL